MIRPAVISLAIAFGLPASQSFAHGSSRGHAGGGHAAAPRAAAPRPAAPARSARLPTNGQLGNIVRSGNLGQNIAHNPSGAATTRPKLPTNPAGQTNGVPKHAAENVPPPVQIGPKPEGSGTPVSNAPVVPHPSRPETPETDDRGPSGGQSGIPATTPVHDRPVHTPPKPSLIKPKNGINIVDPPNGGHDAGGPAFAQPGQPGNGTNDGNRVPRQPGNGGDNRVPRQPGNGINIIDPPNGGRDPGGPPFAQPRPTNPQPPHDGGVQLVGGGEVVGGISIGVSGGDAPASTTVIAPGIELDPIAIEPAEVKNAAAPAIDLEVTDIRLIDVGRLENGTGPRLRVYCRNNGKLEAPKFLLCVMADVGKDVSSAAHLVTVESVGIKPGKTQAIDVQLPVETLKMTSAKDKWPKPFEVLAATADSDDSLRESNEDNNMLKLARDAIKPVEAE